MSRSAALLDSLAIPLPEGEGMILDGCRRVLGPNLFSRLPGAVGDMLVGSRDAEHLLQDWIGHVRTLASALGWSDVDLRTRTFSGGASLYLAAPVDQLFTATFVIEAAWHLLASPNPPLGRLDRRPRKNIKKRGDPKACPPCRWGSATWH